MNENLKTMQHMYLLKNEFLNTFGAYIQKYKLIYFDSWIIKCSMF